MSSPTAQTKERHAGTSPLTTPRVVASLLEWDNSKGKLASFSDTCTLLCVISSLLWHSTSISFTAGTTCTEKPRTLRADPGTREQTSLCQALAPYQQHNNPAKLHSQSDRGTATPPRRDAFRGCTANQGTSCHRHQRVSVVTSHDHPWELRLQMEPSFQQLGIFPAELDWNQELCSHRSPDRHDHPRAGFKRPARCAETWIQKPAPYKSDCVLKKLLAPGLRRLCACSCDRLWRSNDTRWKALQTEIGNTASF